MVEDTVTVFKLFNKCTKYPENDQKYHQILQPLSKKIMKTLYLHTIPEKSLANFN